MKILILTHHYEPFNQPDAKRWTGFANLLSQNHHVEIVTSQGKTSGLPLYEEKQGIIIHRKVIPFFDQNKMLKRLINNLWYVWASRFTKFSCKQYDVIIATSPPLFNLSAGVWLKRKLKAKLICDLRDIWPEVFVETKVTTEKSLLYRVFSKIARNSYQKADLITVVTPTKQKNMAKNYPQFESKLRYVTNGVNDNFLQHQLDDAFKKEFFGTFNVLYSGTIGRAQNIEHYIKLAKAFRDNQDIRFYLMGQGVDLPRILNMIESEQLTNLTYLGNRNEQEVFTALNSVQLLYASLNSAALVDSVPTKIFEALVVGCPILLSAAGDSAEIVQNSGLGIVCDPESFDSLLQGFKQVLYDYQTILENKTKAIQYIKQHYLRSAVVTELEEVLNQLKQTSEEQL